jgi:hypothetical protein
MNVDRTVINGARLDDRSWVPWSPPCSNAEGPGELAASDPLHLVAVCDDGVYGGPPGVRLFFSSDGGTTFVPAPQALPPDDYGPCTSPVPGVVVMGTGQSDLMATFDGGRQWSDVYSAPDSGGWQYLGFTTTSQGVALEQNGTLLVTFDGGHRWAPVAFPSLPSSDT